MCRIHPLDYLLISFTLKDYRPILFEPENCSTDDGNYDSVYTNETRTRNNRHCTTNDNSELIENPYYGNDNHDEDEDVDENHENMSATPIDSEFTAFTRVDNIYYDEIS